jgi:hypothetical protein
MQQQKARKSSLSTAHNISLPYLKNILPLCRKSQSKMSAQS